MVSSAARCKTTQCLRQVLQSRMMEKTGMKLRLLQHAEEVLQKRSV